jgi:hypothetical protein
MSYLTLCQKAVYETSIGGSGPTTVVGQNGQLGNMVVWVREAWVNIQLMRPNWLFMHKEFTFNTVIDQRDYVAADMSIIDLKLWDSNSFLIHDPDLGYTDQGFIVYQNYSDWRRSNRVQMEARASDRPQSFTILPSNAIRFEPKPNKIYTIEGEYKKSTQHFSLDADEPTGLGEDFEMMIVWLALTYYAHKQNAPEVLEQAQTKFADLLFRFEIEQLPEFSDDFAPLA